MRHVLHMRSADQASFEIVGPRVIRALDAAGEDSGGFSTQPGPAMPADVVIRADGPGGPAGDDHAFTKDLAQKELARPLDLFRSAGADPHTREQRIHFPLEELRV